MANFEIPDNPELSLALRRLETTDRGHADVFNELFEVLITNDAFLDVLANKMIEKSLIAHVLDSNNSNMVMGADQGPVISNLISRLESKYNQLNSDLLSKYTFNLPLAQYGQQWIEESGTLVFLRWAGSTENTPYTEGLTSSSAGYQIGYSISKDHKVWFSIDAGGVVFKAYYSYGLWSNWKKVI